MQTRFLKVVALMLALLTAGVASAQTRKITGTVVDEMGLPLIGSVVASQDGKSGAMTDDKGVFTLNVRSNDQTVSVSFLGYLTQNVNIQGKTDIKVQMMPDPNNSLNEVVVIGYGEVKKGDLTGSVGSVKMSDIKEAPGLSVDQALQGRIAGVDIMSSTGEPGAATSIRIRGTRSINASNEPLIVVDGVAGAVTDLNDINSDDIESISVLKDASSTAIYGSRGANGVIMVTTKGGFTSKPNIAFKAQFGVSQIAKKLDVMNAEEFIRYRRSINASSGHLGHGNLWQYDEEYNPAKYGEGTNWLDEITRVAAYQNYNFSMSGKENKLHYYTALGYTDQQGVIKGSGMSRVTGRLNLAYKMFKWMTLSYRGSYTYQRQLPNRANIGGNDRNNGAIYLSPLISPEDNWNPIAETGAYINNPAKLIEMSENIVDRHTTFNTAIVDIMPIDGMVITSHNTYMLYGRKDYRFNPSYLPAKAESEGADAYRYEGDAYRFSSENTISYKKKFSRGHNLDALLGFTVSDESTNLLAVSAKGLLVDALKWNNLNQVASKENYTVTSQNTRVVRESVLARLNYNYKSKYYLTFTGRYDGSSNFAANHKWGFFPSGAFKWNLKQEKFLRRVKDIDELSFRLSAGLTGNDAIAAYSSLERYTSSTGGYLFDGSQATSFYLTKLANPDLTWEKTFLANAGIDLSVLDGRLKFTVEAYTSYTKDLLLKVQIPQTTGFNERYSNLGKTTNNGVELTIDSRNIDTKEFAWNTTFTISHNRQMVEDIGHENYVPVLTSWPDKYMMYGYRKNYPLNSLWGFEYAGPWQNEGQLQQYFIDSKTYVSSASVNKADSENVKTLLGLPKYVDQNHDGSLTEEDLVCLGNSDPVLYGGLNNVFHWKNFKFSFYFIYSLGGQIYNYSELFMGGGTITNQYRYMLDAWHPVRNPDSWHPRPSKEYGLMPSSRQVHDASYLRLKTVSLAYTLPFRKGNMFKDMTFTLTGDNLVLWTRYNGFDPDVSTSKDNSTLRRVDMGAYPKARMVVLGVQLRY